MKTAKVLQYGPPSVITRDDVPQPEPGAGQLLIRVEAAGVGNWDALIRAGKVKLEPLPLILGAEISGVVEATGAEVSGFKPGDEVYGATNRQFSGAYAEYAVPFAGMIAHKPNTLNFVEAASAPIGAVTAWQMLFEYGRVTAGQIILIHGGAGNVGGYAVQLARQAGLHVIATAAARDQGYVTALGAEMKEFWIIEPSDSRIPCPERRMPQTGPGKFTGLASGRNAQHDLAPVMRSTSKQLVGGAYFFEWKHGADVRNQSSAIKQLRDLVQAICGRIRIKVCSSNAITILDGLGDSRHDRHQNPTRFQNPKRPLLRLASDRIKDNIDSLQGILESLGSIIQNSFSA